MSNVSLFSIGTFSRNQELVSIYAESSEFSIRELNHMQSDVALVLYADFTNVKDLAAEVIKLLRGITNASFARWSRVKFYESSLQSGVICLRVSCLSIDKIKEKGLLSRSEIGLVEFSATSDLIKLLQGATADSSLFTDAQRAYVDNIGNDVESLRSHLLNQLRARDTAIGNATFFERESNHASQVAIKLRSILEQLIAENPGSRLVRERAGELAELHVKITAKKDPPPRPVIQCDLKPLLLVDGATTPAQ